MQQDGDCFNIEKYAKLIKEYSAKTIVNNPDTGEGVSNPGFQSRNFLVKNMLAWYEDREYIREF